MHEASALICGGSLAAAREIAEGRADRAVNIAGGLHHAMADRAAGFCVYNDCAVAISWLLDHGFERIAYVDVDVHHGDGVQAAFYDDPRVLTISLHQHPMTLWPGTGLVARVRRGRGRGLRGQPPAAARHERTRAGCGPSTRSCRRCSRRSARSCWSPSAAPTPTAKTRWPTCGCPSTGTATIYRRLRELAEPHGRGALARPRRRRVRPVPGGAAVVDAPDRHRARPRRRPGDTAVPAGLDRARRHGSPAGELPTDDDRRARARRTPRGVTGPRAGRRRDPGDAPRGLPAARPRPRRPARLTGRDPTDRD